MLGLIGLGPNLTPYQKRVASNCKMLRDHVRQYVRDRKAGKRSSKISNKSDILSLFLENPEIFSEDFIVDEFLDLFAAGSGTSMLATQTIICHFATSPQSLAQARDEFEYYLEDGLYEDPGLKKKSKSEILKALTTTDTV